MYIQAYGLFQTGSEEKKSFPVTYKEALNGMDSTAYPFINVSSSFPLIISLYIKESVLSTSA